MVRLSAATCLIAGGITTSLGLRTTSTEPPHRKGPEQGDCPLPVFPKDNTTAFPCTHDDVFAFYGMEWWSALDTCFDNCYVTSTVYAIEDQSANERYCGRMPASGCFDGRAFAECMQDALKDKEPALQVSMGCDLCVGSLLWKIMKEKPGTEICKWDICHPGCSYESHNILDTCAGELDSHLAICISRIFPGSKQQCYHHPQTESEKQLAAYEETWKEFECKAQKSSSETSAKTKSSTGTMAGVAVLKHVLSETLDAGNAHPAIKGMLDKLG